MNFNLEIGSDTYTLDRPPDLCPHCNVSIHAERHSIHITSHPHRHGTAIEGGYICPRDKCHRSFIAVYKRDVFEGNKKVGVFKFQVVYPTIPVPPTHSAELVSISPDYVAIYDQAFIAEAHGLTEICGMAYRKALEFLIKDYCIKVESESSDVIQGKMLGRVIRDHVTDENIKSCASRAAWLGNDETHYVRKWEDKDISDLKTLLELTVHWIRSSLLTQKYYSEMP